MHLVVYNLRILYIDQPSDVYCILQIGLLYIAQPSDVSTVAIGSTENII